MSEGLEAIKREIEGMDRVAMARLWRFSPGGDPRLSGEAGDFFEKRFKELGGMSPAISKQIGWDAA